MSAIRRSGRALRDRLSYANVMATLAVFLVLGGGAYAAATLPANSVGTTQLRRDAVTRSKLADDSVSTAQLVHNSVTRNRLSQGLRLQLDHAAQQGPRGATGATGPSGPKGADGAGAGRIRYDAAATATLVPTTVLDMPGLKMQATCIQNGADVNVGLRITPTESAVLQDTFTLDTGADPANPPQPGSPGGVQTGSGQIALTGNTDNDLGGPGTQNGTGYVRVIARAIMVGATRTFTLDLFELVNADTGRCTIGGTALPST
jgi:hypothetical protein